MSTLQFTFDVYFSDVEQFSKYITFPIQFRLMFKYNIIQTAEALDIFSKQHHILRSNGRIQFFWYVSKIRNKWALAWHGAPNTHQYFSDGNIVVVDAGNMII